jgi:hypothetical protein
VQTPGFLRGYMPDWWWWRPAGNVPTQAELAALFAENVMVTEAARTAARAAGQAFEGLGIEYELYMREHVIDRFPNQE